MVCALRRPTLLRELASFVRESLTRLEWGEILDEKKAPLFRAGLCGLGVRGDASQCGLQILDEGADVLDLACFFRLRLLDHLSQCSALDAFP